MMKQPAAAFFAMALLMTSMACLPPEARGAQKPWEHGPLTIGSDARTLVHQDGTEFFWLGDTAWMTIHRASREEVETYFADRAAKRFNVTLQVGLGEIGSWNQKNRNGDRPFEEGNLNRPIESYWKFVDFVFDAAEQHGMYVAFLPTWGRWVNDEPHITETNAFAYGKFVGDRYGRRPNVIWVLGGDRAPRVKDGIDYRPLWRKMAAGIVEGCGFDPLITFHRKYEWELNREPWYDLYMTGPAHGRKDSRFIYEGVEYDWRLEPAKPIIDGEPPYEDHPVGWDGKAKGYFDPFDVRQSAYWNVLAGAAGYSYGHHSVWQWYWPPTYQKYGEVIVTAQEALDRPGAQQMRHVRTLMESRPLLGREPAQDLLESNFDGKDEGEAGRHMRALRGNGYVMVYTPYGDTIKVRSSRLPWDKLRAWWFNPRDGTTREIGVFERADHVFTPAGEPARGNDWVLVMDDAAKNIRLP